MVHVPVTPTPTSFSKTFQSNPVQNLLRPPATIPLPVLGPMSPGRESNLRPTSLDPKSPSRCRPSVRRFSPGFPDSSLSFFPLTGSDLRYRRTDVGPGPKRRLNDILGSVQCLDERRSEESGHSTLVLSWMEFPTNMTVTRNYKHLRKFVSSVREFSNNLRYRTIWGVVYSSSSGPGDVYRSVCRSLSLLLPSLSSAAHL